MLDIPELEFGGGDELPNKVIHFTYSSGYLWTAVKGSGRSNCWLLRSFWNDRIADLVKSCLLRWRSSES